MNNERNLVCPNCGGSLVVTDEHDIVADCPFCGGHVYFKDKDIENLASSITKLENDNLDDEAKRKAIKVWRIACIVSMIVYAIITYEGYHLESVLVEDYLSGVGAICVFISTFGSIIIPLILSCQRVAYNVLDKKDDKKVRLTAFFKLLAGFFLIWIVTSVVSVIDFITRFVP